VKLLGVVVKPTTAAFKKNKSRKEKPNDRLSVLAGLARQLLSFNGKYHLLFKRHTSNLADRAFHYLKGLFQADKKNMERMEEKIPDAKYDPLQYFISDSDWAYRPVNNQIALDADKLLGGHYDSALYIDETGFPKKGKMSVGVARQWCGQLGKIDNCQVGVFATLGHDRFSTPIDFRLYLPKEWTQDKKRCKKAKVPKKQMEFRSKAELALDMVFDAREKGIRFNWLGCDGFYGSQPEFLRKLADKGEVFMADVHKDQRIYLEDPQPVVPNKDFGKGRKPEKLKVQTDSIRVDKYAEKQPDDSWVRIKVRKSTKGFLSVDIFHKHVWLWDGHEERARRWHLVVRREGHSQEKMKYSLSNAPDVTSIDKLAYMQAQRYWVERPFQDAKNQCGMGEYQARGWLAWHHHMTMVMLAMLFMLEQRYVHKKEIPLLSCCDIATVLKSTLPRKDIGEEEILRQLEVRHKKRQASTDSAYQKQRYFEGLSKNT
jgi:SRSO17 transposase